MFYYFCVPYRILRKYVKLSTVMNKFLAAQSASDDEILCVYV